VVASTLSSILSDGITSAELYAETVDNEAGLVTNSTVLVMGTMNKHGPGVGVLGGNESLANSTFDNENYESFSAAEEQEPHDDTDNVPVSFEDAQLVYDDGEYKPEEPQNDTAKVPVALFEDAELIDDYGDFEVISGTRLDVEDDWIQVNFQY